MTDITRHTDDLFGGQPPNTSSSQHKNSTTNLSLERLKRRSSAFQIIDVINKLGTLIALFYLFILEWFIPEPFRASTIIANKISSMKEEVILDTAAEQAEANAQSKILEANVSLVGQCNNTVLQSALNIYKACQADPKKSHYQCIHEREFYLSNNDSCPEFPDLNLVREANKDDY